MYTHFLYRLFLASEPDRARYPYNPIDIDIGVHRRCSSSRHFGRSRYCRNRSRSSRSALARYRPCQGVVGRWAMRRRSPGDICRCTWKIFREIMLKVSKITLGYTVRKPLDKYVAMEVKSDRSIDSEVGLKKPPNDFQARLQNSVQMPDWIPLYLDNKS